MVRLKAESVNNFSNSSVVSIPYGTIKSRKMCVSLGNYPVSIPYGTIKSAGALYEISWVTVSIPYGTIKSLSKKALRMSLNRFQFLMVRLKELTH